MTNANGVRLNSSGKVLAVLDLKHSMLDGFEEQGCVFVWPDCDECCGWRPTKLSSLRTGECDPGIYYPGDTGVNRNGEIIVQMASNFDVRQVR